MRATMNSESYSSSSKATLKLQNVFCTDPNCSMGCLQESIIRPQIPYTSHFCYLSGFYAGGQIGYGFDGVDVDDKEDKNDTTDSSNTKKKRNNYSSNKNKNYDKNDDDDVGDDATANNAAMETDNVRNIKFQFSLEFVGSCNVQNENCLIIE